jgi:hypothetical protein
MALADLGNVLELKGDLDGSLAVYRKSVECSLPDTRPDRLNDVRRVERWKVLLTRLPDVVAGRAKPPPPEAFEFADLCALPFQRRYARAVRLCDEGFATDPRVSNLIYANRRYEAARYAALAVSGRDAELTAFGWDEWGYLTGAALRWLRADFDRLTTRAKNPQNWPEVRRVLTRWLADPALVPIRDPAWLAAMPPADRREWESLWSDVAVLLVSMQKDPAKP